VQSRGLFNVCDLKMREREREPFELRQLGVELTIHGGNEASSFICKSEA